MGKTSVLHRVVLCLNSLVLRELMNISIEVHSSTVGHEYWILRPVLHQYLALILSEHWRMSQIFVCSCANFTEAKLESSSNAGGGVQNPLPEYSSHRGRSFLFWSLAQTCEKPILIAVSAAESAIAVSFVDFYIGSSVLTPQGHFDHRVH